MWLYRYIFMVMVSIFRVDFSSLCTNFSHFGEIYERKQGLKKHWSHRNRTLKNLIFVSDEWYWLYLFMCNTHILLALPMSSGHRGDSIFLTPCIQVFVFSIVVCIKTILSKNLNWKIHYNFGEELQKPTLIYNDKTKHFTYGYINRIAHRNSQYTYRNFVN